jgi:hypothetical protein
MAGSPARHEPTVLIDDHVSGRYDTGHSVSVMPAAVLGYDRVFDTKFAGILDVLDKATRRAGNAANRWPRRTPGERRADRSGRPADHSRPGPPVGQSRQPTMSTQNSRRPPRSWLSPAFTSGTPRCGLSRARRPSRRTASPPRARRVPFRAEAQGHLLPRRADVVFPVRSRSSTRRVLGCS